MKKEGLARNMIDRWSGSRVGALFFDVARMRNSLLVSLGWSAYVLMSMVDMSFRAEVPGLAWKFTVGLPLALADAMPLQSVLGSSSSISYQATLYVLMPMVLFVASAIMTHSLFFSYALVADGADRRRSIAFVAKELAKQG